MFEKTYLEETVKAGLESLKSKGFPEEALKRILDSATPLGDFAEINKTLSSYEEEQEIFSESRTHGLDGSIDYSYGGSSIGTIRGTNPWQTCLDYWMDARGVPRAENDSKNKEEAFFAGHMMEPVYRKYFEYLHGDRYEVYECDIQFASKKYPHFIMNIDGLVVDKVTNKFGVLEIKHTNSEQTFNNKTIEMFKEGDIPENYYNQGTGYVEGLDADFCIYFLGWGNRPSATEMLRVERDTELGTKILSECEDFVEKYVKTGVKPPYSAINDPDKAKEVMKEDFGPIDPEKEQLELNDLKDALKTLIEAKEAYSLADGVKKEKEAEYKKAQLPFIEALKTATEGTVELEDKNYIVTYKSDDKVDLDKLKDKYPDAYKDLVKESVSITALKGYDKWIAEDCIDANLDGTRKFSFKELKPKKKKD